MHRNLFQFYSKDCKWVADEHKCDWEHNGKKIGEHYCPYSCGCCGDDDWHQKPTTEPTSDYNSCGDDKNYRYYGDYWKVSTISVVIAYTL
jgi:hypothetical protein